MGFIPPDNELELLGHVKSVVNILLAVHNAIEGVTVNLGYIDEGGMYQSAINFSLDNTFHLQGALDHEIARVTSFQGQDSFGVTKATGTPMTPRVIAAAHVAQVQLPSGWKQHVYAGGIAGTDPHVGLIVVTAGLHTLGAIWAHEELRQAGITP